MEKNRIRPVINGKSLRMSYSRQKEVLEMPNLIEVQKNSYNWFLEEGLKEVFADISPIADYKSSCYPFHRCPKHCLFLPYLSSCVISESNKSC